MRQDFDPIILEVYRARDRLQHAWGILQQNNFDQKTIDDVQVGLSRMSVSSIDNQNKRDSNNIAVVESFLKGAYRVSCALSEHSSVQEVSQFNSAVERAEDTASAIIRWLRESSDEPDLDAGVSPRPRDVRVILPELRHSISSSNEMDEKQKQDALGYVGALDSLMKMSQPDQAAFHFVLRRLKMLAKRSAELSFGKSLENL